MMRHAIVPEARFLNLVAERSGQPIASCYQCHKCTAGCPTAYAMDFGPAQVVRLIQLGQRRRFCRADISGCAWDAKRAGHAVQMGFAWAGLPTP
jgi:heterodisulfide reductase subunit C